MPVVGSSPTVGLKTKREQILEPTTEGNAEQVRGKVTTDGDDSDRRRLNEQTGRLRNECRFKSGSWLKKNL